MLKAQWDTYLTVLFADPWVLLSWLGRLSLLMFVGSVIMVPMVNFGLETRIDHQRSIKERFHA